MRNPKRVIRSLFWKKWSHYCQKNIVSVTVPALLYPVISKVGPQSWRESYFRVKRSFKATNAPIMSTALPSIELLVVAAAKDFSSLHLCVNGAIANTSNPISRIVIVVPACDMSDVRLTWLEASVDIDVAIVNEDEVICQSIRDQLSAHFADRYGWVLQQILTVAKVIDSQARGVLVVDADTILTSKRASLDFHGNQILTPTHEMHEPYYQFLSSAGLDCKKPIQSFVPHAMLMQPNYMKEALAYIHCRNVHELAELVIQRANVSDKSPICIEYELYAQFMIKEHPEKVQLAKWGNIEIKEWTKEHIEWTLVDFCRNYSNWNSVSLHSYNHG